MAEVGIKDVARYAGVSMATVSRVLNDSPRVGASTNERVRHAVKVLGYQPNYLARSMRTRSTHVLGLLIRNISNPNFASIAQAAEIAAIERGYNLILCNSYSDPARERNYIELLLRRRVDGILAFVADDSTSTIGAAVQRNVALVLAESQVPQVDADAIETDGEGGVCEAVRHLIYLGHTRIGLLAADQRITPSRQRLAGYRRALAEVGISYDVALVRFCDQEGHAVERELAYLGALRPPVTAVMATSNRLTNRSLEYFRTKEVRLPEELSFVGFDDSLTTRLYDPPVTVVTRDREALGRKGVEMLLERIEGRAPQGYRRIVLPAKLEVRASTAPVSVLKE